MGRHHDDFRGLERDLGHLEVHWDETRKRIGHDKLMQEVSHMQDNRKPWKRFIQLAVHVAMILSLCVGGYYLVAQSNMNAPSSLGQPPTETDTEQNESENMNDVDETEAEQEVEEVTLLVEAFGQQLKMVSLLAPDDVLKESINEHYAEYVSPTLLEKWLDDPPTAPGRLVSSPSPERIEILDVEKVNDDQYEVEGEVMEVTSVESDEVDNQYPITLTVKYIDNEWLIDDVIVEDGILHEEPIYGFTFTLPESWHGYEVMTDEWEGNHLNGDTETGVTVLLRHPEWTEDTPRQDIPIMVVSHEQWDAIQNEEFRVGSAPVPPQELGQNEQYVFGLPARYNFEFLTGYEEVEEILENDPLQLIDVD